MSAKCNISSTKSLKDGYRGEARFLSALFEFQTTVIWRDLNIALHRPEWSSPLTEKMRSTQACDAGAQIKLLAKPCKATPEGHSGMPELKGINTESVNTE